jgi:site-specific DNA recombinase
LLRGSLVLRIEVGISKVVITFSGKAIADQTSIPLKQISGALRPRLPSEDDFDADGENIIVTVPVRLRLRGGIKRVEGWDQSNWTAANARHDPALIRALAKAHEWRGWIKAGDAVTLEDVATRSNHDRKYTRQILKLAFLAPDIQRAILTGRQHKSLTLAALTEVDVPLLWSDQRTLLCTA